MALDKIYSKLQSNLYRSFIFYVPSSLLEEDKLHLITKSKLKTLFDCIMYIDKKGKAYHVITTESLYPLRLKSVTLEKNMFLLLEHQRKLSSTELNFLLEKYSQSLNFFSMISQWMYAYLETFNSFHIEGVDSYFLSQKVSFQHHEKELKKYFQLSRIVQWQKPDWSHLSETHFSLPHLENKETNAELVSIIDSVQKQNKSTSKKKKLMTDDEAQRYLLENVFNIQFE